MFVFKQMDTMEAAANTVRSVNSFFGFDKPSFERESEPMAVALYRKSKAEEKTMDQVLAEAERELNRLGDGIRAARNEKEEPTTIIRNIVVDGNNRIIGAIDTNNKMRRLWPATSAFMPRREEIANDVFAERLLTTEFMVKTAKDFVVILFRKMKVDDVFSPKVIREKLDFDNLSHILAHFDLDEEKSIEKTIVLALQNAAYAHAAEKNFDEGDIKNLAIDLNRDILTIEDLVFIDNKTQFDNAVAIVAKAVEDISGNMSAEELNVATKKGAAMVFDELKKKLEAAGVSEDLINQIGVHDSEGKSTPETRSQMEQAMQTALNKKQVKK